MITIRTYSKNDLQSLENILVLMNLHKRDKYFERCLQEQEQGKRTLFIASWQGEQDSGYVILNEQPRYAPFRRLEIPEIQDLSVIPQARRQGIATALIAHCEALAREKGKTWIGISVGLHAGFGPAQSLYAKQGYLPDGGGVTYDRQPVVQGEIRPIDDDLCLMMVKAL